MENDRNEQNCIYIHDPLLSLALGETKPLIRSRLHYHSLLNSMYVCNTRLERGKIDTATVYTLPKL